MKLIESSVQIIKEKDPYKMIELAGRTCYKSEDKITENSAKEFVDRMIKLGHGAMLEHGTIYLACLVFDGDVDNNNNLTPNHSFYKYQSNKYSKVKVAQYAWSGEDVACVTTNLRVLVENNWLDDLKTYRCEPTRYHERRITAKFICDRGVSHEFVRHRVFSFAQESQRYCAYNKDKFNNEITIVKPHWWDEQDSDAASLYISTWKHAEYSYITLLENGVKPQDARSVLPNATKTELVMTGFESDWEGFFKLRCSGAAHPDAKKLADELRELMVK